MRYKQVFIYLAEFISIKFPNNEILSAKLYQLLNVKIANLELIEFNGQTVITSKWIEIYHDLGDNPMPKNVTGLNENFVIDAWLANWDVEGLDNDNIGFVGDDAIRINLGGSLLYRGMGALKGKRLIRMLLQSVHRENH